MLKSFKKLFKSVLPQDYLRMLDQLPNVVDAFTIEHPKWNHLDFVWAKDIDLYLFPRLMQNINNAEAAFRSENGK